MDGRINQADFIQRVYHCDYDNDTNIHKYTIQIFYIFRP